MCNGSWNRFETLNYIRHLYWSAVHLELLVYSSLPLAPTVNPYRPRLPPLGNRTSITSSRIVKTNCVFKR